MSRYCNTSLDWYDGAFTKEELKKAVWKQNTNTSVLYSLVFVSSPVVTLFQFQVDAAEDEIYAFCAFLLSGRICSAGLNIDSSKNLETTFYPLRTFGESSELNCREVRTHHTIEGDFRVFCHQKCLYTTNNFKQLSAIFNCVLFVNWTESKNGYVIWSSWYGTYNLVYENCACLSMNN